VAVALVLALASPAVARAAPSAADRESARVAFTAANKLRDAGDVRGALEKYKAAYALAPTPVTALEVGRAEKDLGQLVEAREVLLHVESMPASSAESPKARAARREAAALAAKIAQRIPKLVLSVVGPAGAAAITVDGATIPREALSVPRSLDPGIHVVLAVAGGRTVQRSVELREGETREVSLDVTSLAPRGGGVVGSAPAAPAGGGGLVAFSPEDGNHAWTLRDPRGREVCKLPCAQSLGFASGYSVVRDDGQSVTVPAGLAPIPGSSAQVVAYGRAGSVVLGWTLIAAGGAAAIASIPVLFATEGNFASSDTGGLIAFGILLGGGTLVVTVGSFLLGLSHGPALVRTDRGMPMRVARGIHVHLTPTGVAGTF
jgi:hypothetical protein